MGLARFNYRRVRPGGAVNGRARSEPFILTIDGLGRDCYFSEIGLINKYAFRKTDKIHRYFCLVAFRNGDIC